MCHETLFPGGLLQPTLACVVVGSVFLQRETHCRNILTLNIYPRNDEPDVTRFVCSWQQAATPTPSSTTLPLLHFDIPHSFHSCWIPLPPVQACISHTTHHTDSDTFPTYLGPSSPCHQPPLPRQTDGTFGSSTPFCRLPSGSIYRGIRCRPPPHMDTTTPHTQVASGQTLDWCPHTHLCLPYGFP